MKPMKRTAGSRPATGKGTSQTYGKPPRSNCTEDGNKSMLTRQTTTEK